MISESAVRDKWSLDSRLHEINCHTEIMPPQGSNQWPWNYKPVALPSELTRQTKSRMPLSEILFAWGSNQRPVDYISAALGFQPTGWTKNRITFKRQLYPPIVCVRHTDSSIHPTNKFQMVAKTENTARLMYIELHTKWWRPTTSQWSDSNVVNAE